MAVMLKAVAAYFLFSGVAGMVKSEMHYMASTGLIEHLKVRCMPMTVKLEKHEVIFILNALHAYADRLLEEGSAEERTEAEKTGRHLCKLLDQAAADTLTDAEAQAVEEAYNEARAAFCGIGED